MRKLIKVYGERNTNTNYLSELIKLNLNAVEVPGVTPPFVKKLNNILHILPVNVHELVRDTYFHLTYSKNLGWKHTCVTPYSQLQRYKIVNSALVFLTITKNPYSWLLSLYRRPYHQYYGEKPSFELFLQRQWKTTRRDKTEPVLKNPIELWNIKNGAYLALMHENVSNITTESIIENPEGIIDQIGRRFEIERTSNRFVNYEASTKDKSKDSNYYRNYYIGEKWRNELSSEAISIINASVDKDIMLHFGYSYLA